MHEGFVENNIRRKYGEQLEERITSSGEKYAKVVGTPALERIIIVVEGV